MRRRRLRARAIALRTAAGAVPPGCLRAAEAAGVDLAALPLDELKSFSKKIGPDVKRVLTPEGSVAARRHAGGTAPVEVRKAVARARKRLRR